MLQGKCNYKKIQAQQQQPLLQFKLILWEQISLKTNKIQTLWPQCQVKKF